MYTIKNYFRNTLMCLDIAEKILDFSDWPVLMNVKHP